jgi:hypothetical protein
MDKHKDQHNNGGFVLGLLIGVLVTLAITTKKGRKLLRMVTEEGKDKFSEWDEILEDIKASLSEDDYVSTVHDYKEDVEKPVDVVQDKTMDTSEPQPSVTRVKSTARRFFRGVSRRG